MQNEQSEQENSNSGGADKAIPVPSVNAVNKKGFGNWARNNPVLLTALIGLIVAVAIYFWKDMAAKKQKAAIEKMANEQLVQSSEEMLKLIAKPLVWSIRAEMLRDNLEQVNIFTKDLVKEKNFQFIHLIDPDGKIIISTDKKLEGQSAIGLFDENLKQTDSVTVVNKENNMLTLTAPVMGYDKRLGLLILDYAPVKFITDKDKKK